MYEQDLDPLLRRSDGRPLEGPRRDGFGAGVEEAVVARAGSSAAAQDARQRAARPRALVGDLQRQVGQWLERETRDGRTPDRQATRAFVERAVQDALSLAEATGAARGLAAEPIAQEILDHLDGAGVLERYLRQPGVTEVLFNGTHSTFVYQGDLRLAMPALGELALYQLKEYLLRESGESVSRLRPTADARIAAKRLRINVVDRSLAPQGYVITVRVFPEQPYGLGDLVALGTLPAEVADFLRAMVRARASIAIAGGTGSGKSTTWAALAEEIPAHERVVFIESPAELPHRNPHHVVLETARAGAEGGTTTAVRELVINALRMKPDRILVGEVRGPEALDAMEAFATGHEGSLITLHATTAAEVPKRLLAMMYMGASAVYPERLMYGRLFDGLDLILLQRELRLPTAAGGAAVARRLVEIHLVAELDAASGSIRTEPLFAWREGRLQPVGGRVDLERLTPRLRERVQQHHVEVPVVGFPGT